MRAYVLDVTSTETITETSDKVEVVKDIFDNYETSDNNKEVFGLKTLSPAKLLQNKEHLDPEIKEKYLSQENLAFTSISFLKRQFPLMRSSINLIIGALL